MKTNTMLSRFILLSLITGGIIYATGVMRSNHMRMQNAYHDMSITELQEEVERLSQHGNLPFCMGVELLQRWAQR